jgi:hypothetical protein
MYIFARSRRINPARTRAAFAAAIEAGNRASEIMKLPVYVWAAVLSDAVGTVVWSTRVEHLDELIAAQDAVAGSDFGEWIEQNDDLFSGPIADVVSEVIAGAPTSEPGPFVQTITGICANGSMSEAMGTGVELAEAATRITGVQTAFIAPVVGAFGSVGWLSSHANLASIEAANAALRADNDWLKMVDRAGHSFQPGVTSLLLRRIS